MPYASNGTLTTDTREIATSESWETQTEWEAYQSISGIEITNGTLTLSETTYVENFNSTTETPPGVYASGEDLTDYYTATGDFTPFTRVTSPVFDGDMSLQVDADDAGTWIYSTVGLPNYPSLGDTFKFYIQPEVTGSGWLRVSFGWQDSNNYYAIGFRYFNSDIHAVTSVGGSLNAPSSSFTYGNGWHEVTVTWDSGGFDATIVEVNNTSNTQTVSVSDTNFDTGGIAFYNRGNNASWIDGYETL